MTNVEFKIISLQLRHHHLRLTRRGVQFEYFAYLLWRTGNQLEVVLEHLLIVNMNKSQEILVNHACLKIHKYENEINFKTSPYWISGENSLELSSINKVSLV